MLTERDSESGRSLLLHAVVTPTGLTADFKAPSQYFVAMLVCDGSRISDKDIAHLSRKLINAGCVYLCCWGRECERIHDLFDAEWIENGFDPESSDTIMTTWHTHDSLDACIQHAIWFTEPTDKYQEQCTSVVAIVIDDRQAADRIREVFIEPADFYAARLLDG